MRMPLERVCSAVVFILIAAGMVVSAQSFILEQIKGYPFPNELTAAAVFGMNRGSE